VTDVLLDTRVTLYAVNPTTSAAGMVEITDPTQLEFAQAAGGSFVSNANPFGSQMAFDRLGPITGGRGGRHERRRSTDRKLRRSRFEVLHDWVLALRFEQRTTSVSKYTGGVSSCRAHRDDAQRVLHYVPGQSELKGNTDVRPQHGCAQFHSARRVEGDR
jgi:hypothetical protein